MRVLEADMPLVKAVNEIIQNEVVLVRDRLDLEGLHKTETFLASLQPHA